MLRLRSLEINASYKVGRREPQLGPLESLSRSGGDDLPSVINASYWDRWRLCHGAAGMICHSVINASYWDRWRLCHGAAGMIARDWQLAL